MATPVVGVAAQFSGRQKSVVSPGYRWVRSAGSAGHIRRGLRAILHLPQYTIGFDFRPRPEWGRAHRVEADSPGYRWVRFSEPNNPERPTQSLRREFRIPLGSIFFGRGSLQRLGGGRRARLKKNARRGGHSAAGGP